VAGYFRQLPTVVLIDTFRAAFQLGNDVAHPIALFGMTNFGLSWIYIFVLLAGDFLTRKMPDPPAGIARMPPVLRWTGYYALTLAVLLCWNSGSAQFIYFTF
jgi:hypothetical protein